MELDVTSVIEIIGQTPVVRMDQVQRLAQAHGLSRKAVELSLLDKGIVPHRYLGNTRVFGTDGQARLLRSTVTVIGCGGLGGAVTELCARTGIGRIRLVDGDRFDEGNLNRQLLSTEDQIGRSKAECARERVQRINSSLEADAFAQMMTRENVDGLICGADCVIDALDNAPDRLILQDACRRQGIALVHGAIGNLHAQVTSVFPGDDALDRLYGRDQFHEQDQVHEQEPYDGRTLLQPGMAPPGNPAVSVFICAALEAAEMIKIILGIGDPLRNQLLRLDLMRNEWHVFPMD